MTRSSPVAAVVIGSASLVAVVDAHAPMLARTVGSISRRRLYASRRVVWLSVNARDDDDDRACTCVFVRALR